MTKTKLLAFLTASMRRWAKQGYHYEVHIYRDLEHWRRSCGQHESLTGDFMPWKDAKKHVEPGVVFDVYIYAWLDAGWDGLGRDRELIDCETITLPGRYAGTVPPFPLSVWCGTDDHEWITHPAYRWAVAVPRRERSWTTRDGGPAPLSWPAAGRVRLTRR